MKFLFVLPVVVLLAASGGFFVLKDWQEETVVEENNSEIKTEITIKEISRSDLERPTTTEEQVEEKEIDDEELIAKSREIILNAEELISQARQFIEDIRKAKESSSNVRGVYAGNAADRKYFNEILEETSLNGIVIDVKEAYGKILPLSLEDYIKELHQKDVWTIARIVVFRDYSLTEEHPEWYLINATSTWLDPQSEEAQEYIVDFSKKVIDFGFDELQFDYIRYPENYQGEEDVNRIEVISGFFEKLSKELKSYKADIILSVDLFGYIASQFQSFDIGQRLSDAAKHFDYLSFMLYPSHFYGGFRTNEIYIPYPELVERPYEVVYHSVLSAGYHEKTRPWLQDFNLAADAERGIFYDAEKVRAQIEASQNAASSGWLLWNSSYIYTQAAFK